MWRQNVEPLKTIWDPNAKGLGKVSGMGLGQLFGLSLMGLDTARAGVSAYRQAELEGNSPLIAATKATAGQGAKNIVIWEVAGAGFALGRKLLPGFHLGKPFGRFAGSYIPLGGFALGTLMASGVSKLLKSDG
ncbi:MAG: hypothetical protein AB7P76_09965 [Candidatus Melainabacteria bacterium]